MGRLGDGGTLVADAKVFWSGFIAAKETEDGENVAQRALSTGAVEEEGVERAEHDRLADWPVAVGVLLGVAGVSGSAVCENGSVGVLVGRAFSGNF